MQIVIQDGKVAVCALNRPVCHILAVDVHVIALELLFRAVERERIDVFAIDDRCLKGRRDYAVTQQILRAACLHNGFIIHSGINSHMMLHYSKRRRMEFQPFIHFIWKALIFPIRKCGFQFVFCHFVPDHCDRDAFQIFFAFPFLLFFLRMSTSSNSGSSTCPSVSSAAASSSLKNRLICPSITSIFSECRPKHCWRRSAACSRMGSWFCAIRTIVPCNEDMIPMSSSLLA